MLCPNCDTTLKMTFRQNIEIDYCPNCRGVWLDRGELDKLIERAHDNRSTASPDRVPLTEPSLHKRKRGHEYHDDESYYSDDDRHHREYERRGKPRKYQSDKRYHRKKSWKRRGKDVIEEIFDIFD